MWAEAVCQCDGAETGDRGRTVTGNGGRLGVRGRISRPDGTFEMPVPRPRTAGERVPRGSPLHRLSGRPFDPERPGA